MLGEEIREHFDAGGPRAAGRGDEMHRALGLLPAFQDHLDLATCDRVADDEIGQIGDTEAGEQRASQVRTMDRSERIRTYNWPENRISDHRINYKSNNLDSVLDGNMDDLIGALQTHERQERLEAE